jgi:predicted transcriptional regulator
MKVEQLMDRPAPVCRPEDSLDLAAALLWDNDCGILPVLDRDGRVTATMTDCGICMGAYTRTNGLAGLRVADLMSRTPLTCRASDDSEAALRIMDGNGMRRILVVDDDNHPCGILWRSKVLNASRASSDPTQPATTAVRFPCRSGAIGSQASGAPLCEASTQRAARFLAGRSDTEC